MGETILLTGGSGFVGSAVVAAARRRGLDLRARSREEVDILRPQTLDPAVDGMATVIHAAGGAHLFLRTPATESVLYRTNVEGTRNVVRAARRAGVGRIVLVSSVSVHGDLKDVYARSKADAERAAIDESEGAIPLTILRLAAVYGEGDRGNVFRLVRAVDRHRFVFLGRGDNRKSLIHRDDVADAILAAASGPAGGVFDVTAPAIPMREVVRTIAHELGRSVLRLPIGPRPALAVAHACAALTFHHPRAALLERNLAKWFADDACDGSEFCRRFGFQPSVPFAEGIAREIAWYRGSSAVHGQ